MKSNEKKDSIFERWANRILAWPFLARYFARNTPEMMQKKGVFRELYPMENAEEKWENHRRMQVVRILQVIVVCLVLTAFVAIYEVTDSVLKDGNVLVREHASGSSYTAELFAFVKEQAEKIPFTVSVNREKLDAAEAAELFQVAEDEVEETVRGENASLNEVRSPLHLVESVHDDMVSVEWQMDSYEVLDTAGNILEEHTTEEGTVVELTATMTYASYSADYVMYAVVYPPILTEKELLEKEVQEAVDAADAESETEETFTLPEEAGGHTISWKKQPEYLAIKMLALGVAVGVLLWYEGREELKRKREKREQQLLVDYPEIVNKLALLLGAGMPMKAAWERISIQYRVQKEKDTTLLRYGYEEMLVTYYQMQEGVSEQRAYEAFGKRCRLRQYMKLAALITQNLRMGSAGIGQRLQQEVREAFEERKARARQKGEEASTKMLGPMIVLLVVVMMIVMVPGFLSFSW